MSNKKLFILSSIAAIVFLLSLQNTFACSCAATPTVLDEFENSELVIIAKFVSVDKIREKENKYDTQHIRSAKMKVEKVFKGNVKVGDELTFAQGNDGFCTMTFSEESIGNSFLFYLDKPTNKAPFVIIEEDEVNEPMYYAFTCGRSGGSEGNKDLTYLNNIDKLRGKTRISGNLTCLCNKGPNSANIPIKIIGKDNTYNVKTDKNGFYEIYDVPAGDYILEIQTPKDWTFKEYLLDEAKTYKGFERDEIASKYKIKMTLKEGRHAELNLYFENYVY